MLSKSKLSQHISALITILLWSLAYVLTRVAVRQFTPEAIAFLRYLSASVALIIYGFVKRMRLPKLRDVPLFFLGGAIGFAAYVYTFNLGAKTVTASVSSLIISASPIITVALAQVFLREKIGVAGWASVICAFAGVGIITIYSGGFSLDAGILWICIAAVLISIYNIFQRMLVQRYNPLEVTTYCIIAGTILLTVFAPQAIPQLFTAPAYQILIITVLGVFSGAAAYVCWAYALSKAERTGQVTNYMFLTPIITTFMGYTMIGETPHISAFWGGALVLLGLLLVNRQQEIANTNE